MNLEHDLSHILRELIYTTSREKPYFLTRTCNFIVYEPVFLCYNQKIEAKMKVC